MIWEKLGLDENDILVPFSTKDDEGKFTMWDIINLLLSADSDEAGEDAEE